MSSPIYDHSHLFQPTIACPQYFPPGSSVPAGCGCWHYPGTTSGTTHCAMCGLNNNSICGSTDTIGFAYFIIGSDTLFDYNQVVEFVYKFNYNYNPITTYCCTGFPPDACINCNCGTVNIDWEGAMTYLYPAHDPYYQPCPDPRLLKK